MVKNGKISLLESIVIDYTLPKYNHVEKQKSGIISNSFTINSSGTSSDRFVDTEKRNVFRSLGYQYSLKPSFKLRLSIWFYKTFILKTKDVKSISLKELTEFFESIKTNVSVLDNKNITEILSVYSTTLENAKSNNQVALVEKITDYAEILKMEIILSTSKFNKYLSEDDVVKFHEIASTHKKLKTNLCLTYIKNFIKIIPQEVTKLKMEADDLKIFDNYVILHYDKTGQSVSDTKEEVAKKKDPILFGVINGSTNLYYIGDWIDDYCDLTLDVIIKKIGSVGVIDKDSIKNNISKI